MLESSTDLRDYHTGCNFGPLLDASSWSHSELLPSSDSILPWCAIAAYMPVAHRSRSHNRCQTRRFLCLRSLVEEWRVSAEFALMSTVSLRSASPHYASVTSTCIKVRLIVRNVDSVACYRHCLFTSFVKTWWCDSRKLRRDREHPPEWKAELPGLRDHTSLHSLLIGRTSFAFKWTTNSVLNHSWVKVVNT